MEDLLEKFSSGLTTEPDETQQYRQAQYKNRDSTHFDQDSRRNILLSHQKGLRQNEIDSRRGILEVLQDVEFFEEESSKKVYIPSSYVPGFHDKKRDLSDTLMLSEWLTEAPKDLNENWLMLVCPKGIRVLLLASRGRTKLYNKLGKLTKVWQSLLPGGNSNFGGNHKSCVVLDCIWSDATKSVYVLDILVWVNQPVTDCDMDFRDNWLKAKFSEYPLINEISDQNHYPIYVIPKYPCDSNTISKFMSHWPPFCENNPHVDGFLFYHKQAHYIGGATPLAGWIYPYMVNEVLGPDILVHEEYLKMRPDNYVDKDSFIKAFEEKQSLKKLHIEKRQRKTSFQNTEINIKLCNQSNETNNSDTMIFSFSGNCDVNNKLNGKKKNKRQLRNIKENNMDIDVNVSNVSIKGLNESGSSKDMEFDGNISNDVDSAISSMEDSISEDTKIQKFTQELSK
ncbi:snurportin-1 [Arctopsyche grandis]|uniref:snurportin-1 n=1 Tax=Arctopsyche grandis TaxID=121162 RepID=UPI00406D92C6